MSLYQLLIINKSFIVIVLVAIINTYEYKSNISTSTCITTEVTSENIYTTIPDCVIQVTRNSSADNTLYSCVGHSAVKVKLESSEIKIEIICTANYRMTVNARFLDGFTSELDARIFSEYFFNENGMYRNVVKIQPHCTGRRSVRYSISTDKIMSSETIVLLMYKLDGNDIHWLPEDSNRAYFNHQILKPIAEAFLIPCIPYGNDTNVLFQEGLTNEWIPLLVDDSTLKFEPSSGFILNTTLHPEFDGSYRCWDVKKDKGHYFTISNIYRSSEYILKPNLDKVVYYAHEWGLNSGLSLECSHTKPVELDGTIFFGNGSSIRITETSSSTSKNSKFPFTVRYQNEHLKPNDQVFMQVRLAGSGLVVHSWDVTTYDIEKGDTMGTIRLQRDKSGLNFYCSSNTNPTLSLKYILCSTRTQCRLIQSCLEQNSDHPCNLYTFVDVGRTLTCNYEEDHESKLSCQGSIIASDGVLICSVGTQYKFVDIRFKGHDQIQYFINEDAPDHAKIVTQLVTVTSEQEDEQLRTDTEYLFECKAKRFFTEGEFYWYLGLKNGSRVALHSQEGLAFVSSDLRRHTSEMAIASAKITFFSSEITGLICKAPISEAGDWITSNFGFKVLESQLPEIQARGKIHFRVGEKNQRLTCDSVGVPNPQIEWSLDNGENISNTITVEGSTLKFPEFDSSLSGVYVCNASNVLGWVIKEIQVLEESDIIPLIIGLIGGLGVLFVVVLPATITYYRRKMNSLSREDLNSFFKGYTNYAASAEGSTETAAENKPYPIEFEIEKDRLIINKSKLLGSGEFGEVYLGKLNKNSKMDFVQVAVKSPKPQCPKEMFKIILVELKIMAYIGEHENIVQLIGACTGEIGKGILFMAIEFCELGSLEEFLQKNREMYGNEDLPTLKPLTKNNYQPLDHVMNNFVFGFKDLLKWSYETSAGMVFLAHKNIIHCDLATRNILLSSDRTAKIADFGLSRQMFHYKTYIKSKDIDVALPWRWMAIESLTSRIFSTKSDVWSFGITLWEVFSLGNLPYPGLDWNVTFGEQLKFGLRNIQPEQATTQIYQIMVDCWNSNPDLRPSFSELKEIFQDMRLKHGSEFERSNCEKISHYKTVLTESGDVH